MIYASGAPMQTYTMSGDCGCGDVAPVSYESDGTMMMEGAIEGCVGEGCGETIYETGDAVIETEGSATPVEAPAVEAADDKEA